MLDRPWRPVRSVVECFPLQTARTPIIDVPNVCRDLGLLLVERASTVVGARIVWIVRIALGGSRRREDDTKSHDDEKLFHGRTICLSK
jgi:hypothetical protein